MVRIFLLIETYGSALAINIRAFWSEMGPMLLEHLQSTTNEAFLRFR